MIDKRRLAVRCSDVVAGDWFVPVSLHGEDQHALIPEAVARGAAGFVYERGCFEPSSLTDVASAPVDDLRAFLFRAAEERRAQLTTRVAVVAGSFGKSTVKEMAGSILRAASRKGNGPIHFSPENWNTKSLLATQLTRLPGDCRLALFEMGARQRDDFAAPLRFLQPELACLLNIGRAHLGVFGSQAALETTKLSVLNAPSLRTLVVPRDAKEIFTKAQNTGRNILSFGRHPSSDLCVKNQGAGWIELTYQGQLHRLLCDWQGPGLEQNMAAAAAIALGLGLGWQEIVEGLAAFRGLPGRFERSHWNNRPVVDDAFNGSPESLVAGLERFAQLRGNGMAVLVLGSMLELGRESPMLHAELGRWLAQRWQTAEDWLVTVGEEAHALGEAAQAAGWRHWQHCEEAKSARAFLTRGLPSWESVYLKGSKAIGLQGLLRPTGKEIER